MKSNIFACITVVFAIAIALNPQLAIDSAKHSLSICASSVIPSLFPFFVCSFILTRLNVVLNLSQYLSKFMRPIFGLSGISALPMVLGFISGYPVGAKTVADMVSCNTISRSEGEKLLAFCNNSGPLFILGAVGSGMLKNAFFGAVLYFSHLLSALSVALIMRKVKCETTTNYVFNQESGSNSFGTLLSEAVSHSAASVLNVCGYIVLFGIFISLISNYLNLGILTPFVYGLFEATSACSYVASNYSDSMVICMLISAIIGWSGISVHIQVLAAVNNAGLSSKKYFWGKFLLSIISPLYTFLFLKYFGASVTVFSPMPTDVCYIYIWGSVYSIITPMIITMLVYALSSFKKGR